MPMKRWIDFATWPRYQHYLFFKDFEIPRYNMTFTLDISHFYDVCKQKGYRFYFAMMHVIVHELNQLENFRYRIEDGKVFDETITYVSFTDLIADTDLFKMVFVNVNKDLTAFQDNAIAASQAQGRQLIRMETEKILNTVYITSFPWASFQHLTHATKLGPTDSVPRISWDRFVEKDGIKTIHLSVEAHHGLVDGVHLGLLIQQLQQRLNQF